MFEDKDKISLFLSDVILHLIYRPPRLLVTLLSSERTTLDNNTQTVVFTFCLTFYHTLFFNGVFTLFESNYVQFVIQNFTEAKNH